MGPRPPRLFLLLPGGTAGWAQTDASVTNQVQVPGWTWSPLYALLEGVFLATLARCLFGALLSLFGVDVVFWNQPSALGIAVSTVVCGVASLNLFLDYEFIRQSSIQGAPKHTE